MMRKRLASLALIWLFSAPALADYSGPPNGSNAINQSWSLSGSAALNNQNSIIITDDTLPCAFCTTFYIKHSFGGATTRGTQTGYFSWMIQTTANTGTGATDAVGVAGIGQSNVGDGGTGLTSLTSKGAYFGANFIARNSGTNVRVVVATEDDVETQTASSSQYSFGHSVVNFEAVQGTALDVAYVIYSGGSVGAAGGAGPWGPGIGYHTGISFAEILGNGLPPVDSGATLLSGHLESLATINAAIGIDLTNFTFSGAAFKSNLFSVTQTGNVFAIDYWGNGHQGLTCAAGTPTASFATFGGIVTHC